MSSYPPVEAVVRGLRVLQAMNEQPVTTVHWLHSTLGLPRPSLVRLLQTLEACGYVKHAPQPGAYMLTSNVQLLSSGYHGEPRVVEIVAPLLDELTAQIKWPAAIAVPEGDAVVVRYSTIPSSPLALLHSTMGMRLSLVSRALGRAYLAFCEPEVQEALIALAASSKNPEDLPARQRRTLLPTLELIQRQGYAVREPRIRPVSRSLAVPLFDTRRAVASIGITWFASTLTNEEAVSRYLDLLLRTASTAQKILSAD